MSRPVIGQKRAVPHGSYRRRRRTRQSSRQPPVTVCGASGWPTENAGHLPPTLPATGLARGSEPVAEANAAANAKPNASPSLRDRRLAPDALVAFVPRRRTAGHLSFQVGALIK